MIHIQDSEAECGMIPGRLSDVLIVADFVLEGVLKDNII